jgi:tryptophan halogenase
MKRVAEKLGVRFVDGNVVKIEQDENGNVTNLKLDGADDVSADLFVDCSGFSSLLLNKTLGQRFVSYSDTLFCDRAAIGSWARDDAIRPHTTTETMDSGWCWRIEFDDMVTRGYVYSSQFISDDEAVEEMRSKNPKLGDEIRIIQFPRGRYENYFVKNVIAIGNSSGFVEPLEATALHLIAVQVSAACGALLDSNCMIQPIVQKTINQQFRTMWDDVRDFLAVHYKFNQRLDTPFWKHCREHTDLGGAEALLEMWRESGPHRLGEACIPRESIFRYEGYLTMLIGQRVETKYKSNLTQQDREDWEAHLNRMRGLAQNALPVRDALKIVTEPSFQWPEA